MVVAAVGVVVHDHDCGVLPAGELFEAVDGGGDVLLLVVRARAAAPALLEPPALRNDTAGRFW